ncbi:MAG: sulfatase-like hydrolase/transferase [Thermomicrobiales bacterium]|nr:sulfatase-like hydrolase/transferase [Thermomicrobiales bacterium]
MAETRPNLLIIMSDEHAPQFMGAYGHPVVRSPNLDRLAGQGVLFENAYCNSPLCSPSRMSFMTGRYVHEIGAYDNSNALSVDEPTWAHRLRSAGYEVVLCGKQHFVGPDQLHGFNEQLGRDLHAESFHELHLWEDGTPPAAAPWGHMAKAGPGRTVEIDVDDAVEEAALSWICDPARREQPWALDVGFIAPHFPFVVPQDFWDLYTPEEIDMPRVRPNLDDQPPVYQRMRQMFGLADFTDEEVRRARLGYYALISWFDEKVGRLLAALDETGQRENTVVIYVSDHGEMAGEHGMWRKSNFREASARIPMIVSWPGHYPTGKTVSGVTSLVDLVATMLDIADAPIDDSLDGDSLLPLILGEPEAWKDEAFCEYLAHGVRGPMAMLRRGRDKLNYSLGDPLELFDIEGDPDELTNLATDPAYASIRDALLNDLLGRWDPVALEKQVRASQEARKLIEETVPPESYIRAGG